MAEIIYRDAAPADLQSLQSLHYDMFPVDYEQSFFERVVNHQDGLQNLTAISRDSEGNEALIGFVTARAFRLWECDPVDRAQLGLGDRLLDHETVFYILTLAVSPHYRRRGVGSRLVGWVVNYAQDASCRAAYLHVIDYNTPAMALYWKQGFSEIACRQHFYHIMSGRQPNPKQSIYDAYLFAYVIDTSIESGLMSYLLLAFLPFRTMLDHLQVCLPWKTPPGNYFGGGELPSLDHCQQGSKGSSSLMGRGSAAKQMPPWLVSLFSRQKLLRRQ